MQTEGLNTAVIIPARGGSRGVPNKNLREIGGKTLLGRAAMASSLAKSVDAVYVSTDSDEISEEALCNGAMVIKRPDVFADDRAPSESAILHAIAWMIESELVLPDILVMVQCTAPFMRPEDIDGCIDRIVSHGVDHSFCAAPFDKLVWNPSAGTMPSGVRLPRQERSVRWLEAGSVYAFRLDRFMKERTRFCGCGIIWPIEPVRCLEIDTEDDLLMCRKLAESGSPWA